MRIPISFSHFSSFFFELALRISQTSIPRNYQSKKKFLRKPCGEIFFSTPKRKKFTKKITAKWSQCSYNLASKISGRSIQPSKSQIRLDLRFLFFWDCFCDWIENFCDTFDITLIFINLFIQWRQRKSEEDLHRLKFKNIRKRNGRCEKWSKFNYEKLEDVVDYSKELKNKISFYRFCFFVLFRFRFVCGDDSIFTFVEIKECDRT